MTLRQLRKGSQGDGADTGACGRQKGSIGLLGMPTTLPFSKRFKAEMYFKRPVIGCARMTGYSDKMPQGGTASQLSNNTLTDKARLVSSIEARFPKVALVDPQRGHGIDVRGAERRNEACDS